MGYQNVYTTNQSKVLYSEHSAAAVMRVSQSMHMESYYVNVYKWHTTLICTILVCCVIIIMTFTFAMPTIIYTAICEGCDM